MQRQKVREPAYATSLHIIAERLNPYKPHYIFRERFSANGHNYAVYLRVFGNAENAPLVYFVQES
jgi:hypothetical protein